MTSRANVQLKLDKITTLLAQPSGFARLDPNQRKFLFAAVLAMIVPADGKVKDCERQKLQSLLQANQSSGYMLIDAMNLAELPRDVEKCVDALAKALGELLGAQDRSTLVRHLWELALSDDELHDFEERLIYRIADASGVARKNVAAELAKAAANH